MSSVSKAEKRVRRQSRVRKKIRGSSEMPRLCVFRSNKHVYAQIIDDTLGGTLAEASSLSKDFRPESGILGANKKGAALVGDAIAKRALEKGIKKVVFDRNGFLYHGRVKSLSEAARAAGLQF
jgi:large subunit ribosomal protein L18